MNTVGFGLIGTGRHGERYAGHLLRGEIPGASLTAICRRDETAGREQAARWSVPFHNDARSISADRAVDALLVVSSAGHHVESIEAAAEAGKPALVEKPLAVDRAGCDRIAEAAERAGIDVMVAHTSRYEGAIIGLLGNLYTIEPVRDAVFSLRSEDRTHSGSDFQEKLDDGGAHLDSGVHYFDLLPRLIGSPVEVWCERHFVRSTPIDDGYTALFRTSDGARAVIDMGRWGNSRHESIAVTGEKGILLASRTPSTLERIVGRERETLSFPSIPGTLIPTLEDFVRVCRGEIRPPITIDEGRFAVSVADACRESDGRWVPIV